ncbi:glutathione S-transferase A4-like [Eubalaena glacialis]|uniref:glutathione S-transferase A4-like n=1 Tax=Eubalaena glacialis TaxID=27606 RepID=UPI002A5AEA75|nr:glutathione S-transferase A4-like [Eubalaena glacialis]
MAGKPKVYYFNGRGRMETIWWPLATAGVEALRDHGQDFLVGNRLSWADVQLLEVIFVAEDCRPSVLSGFRLPQEFKARSSYIPRINKFLQPGSQRKSPLDEDSIETVKNIFKSERGMFLKNMGNIVAEY